jgi:hypothetical protein
MSHLNEDLVKSRAQEIRENAGEGTALYLSARRRLLG